MLVKSLSSDRGFTLIEVLLAITILAVALIPILNYFINSTQLVHRSEIRSQALKLARSSLEIIKGEAAENWPNLTNYLSEFNIDELYDSTAFEYDLLSAYSVTASEISSFDFNGDGLTDEVDTSLGRRITVTVSWRSTSNATEVFKLETLVARK